MGQRRAIGTGIVPTPVGVNQAEPKREQARKNCPHARGGEPDECMPSERDYLLSPRPWG